MLSNDKETCYPEDVAVFDGNPLEYFSFMRAFQTVIEDRKPDQAAGFHYFARSWKSPIIGEKLPLYETRERLLAMTDVDKVKNGPVIKAEDAEALEGFAIRKIVQRIPPKLQASWQNNADRILIYEAR